ncbi:MAG: hypothetical protein HUU35_03045 [Armatimonadetes bacterium]|nr:hypothetical protein [Armatimonadota bacterium]
MVLAPTARAPITPKATHRQFAGLETVFTRRQLVQFLSLLIEHLLDGEQAWPVQAMSDQSAAQVAALVGHFRDELKASGVDVQQVDEALQELGVADPATLMTGTADLRIVSDENLTGRAEATLLGSFRSRLRYGLSVGTRADEPFPADRDRETIESYHLEYDLARHLTLGIGRRSRLLGPGRNGLLLSDRAEPIDSVYLAWRTQVFGRPFSIQQQTGGFGFDRGRYVTIRRYQYLPARQLTLGLNFGLITDLGGQAVASFFLPDYAYRFVGGNTSGGGRGNWLGSFDAAYRLSREWAVYGEMFADEFDFSPSPPRTAQRLGYLAGVHYTPRWALPGTSYRLEGTLIPDRGTYVGQQDVGLAWLREGVLFGHPYGEDSAGWRLDIHHRLAPNFDVTLGAEHFRQLRSRAIQPRTTRLELALHYDLNHWSAVGTGIRFRRFEDRAGIANNDLDDDAWYFETRLGY